MEKAAIHEGVKLSGSRHSRGKALGLACSWLCLFAACTTTGKASEPGNPSTSGPTAVAPGGKFDPKTNDPAVTNPNPAPTDQENKFKATAKEYVYFKAENGLTLDIASNGWAYWSTSTHATFSKNVQSNGDVYLIYEYGNSYTGYYLSYARNGYVGVYQWGNSVPWNVGDDKNAMTVKDKDWKTYEYVKDGNWVVIGHYDYTQRDLFPKGELQKPN